jgi:phosphate:Na+ symporter
MIGQIVIIAFKLMGALGLFMYGMQLSSDGIQRAAGDKLQKTVNLMTRNRFVAVFTGIIVTVLIQSSSATTVMVVSFVNAGLLTLIQAIGVIMGANIGTTLTGWIIAAVGVQKFSIALVAVPLFGIGFFMSLMKKKGEAFVSYGEGIMGFALIFLGLEYLSKAIPDPSGDTLLFLGDFANRGWFAIIVCVLVGMVFTMLINASSATLAIVIGLAGKGIINFEMAAALTLGANIGTTFDSFLVSLGTNTNAKRAAWAHILFNVIGTVWVIIVLRPFIAMVDVITPGPITAASAGVHIAMLHTMFNLANTIVLLPFVKQYADILTRFIKNRPDEDELSRLDYHATPLLGSPELNMAKARADIGELARVSESLFSKFRAELTGKSPWTPETIEYYSRYREYSTRMNEGISKFLLDIAQQDIAEKTRDNIGAMLRLVTDLDNICACCSTMAAMQEKGIRKKLVYSDEQIGQLEPFTRLVAEFLAFTIPKTGKPLQEEDLARAEELESRVDAWRGELKKVARKRINKGSDVKLELQYIDLIRHIEKIGDYCWSIAMTLKEMK